MDKATLMAVEDFLLPGLVRGGVVSNSDMHGRVWYSITEDGLKLAKSSDCPEEPP